MPAIESGPNAAPARHPFIMLMGMLRAPGRYLTDESIALPQWTGMLAWIIRGFGAIKLAELYPWRKDWVESIGILLALAAAPALAKAWLAAGAPIVDRLARPFARRKDRLAAARSMVCIAAIPNPFTAFYFLGPWIAKAFGNPVAGFVFYGSCALAGSLLDGLAMGQAYRLPRLRRAVLAGIISVPAAILNAFRLQYLQSLGMVAATEKSIRSGMQLKADSLGIWLPGYTWRKLYDGEEQREIVRAAWARALMAAYDIGPEDPEPGPEKRRLQAYRGKICLLLFRNTFGRIMAGMAVPLYQNYARTVRENRRESEAVRAALLFRAARAESGRTPCLDALPGGLEFTDTFALAGDSLISAEPARSKVRFAISIGKPPP